MTASDLPPSVLSVYRQYLGIIFGDHCYYGIRWEMIEYFYMLPLHVTYIEKWILSN